VGPERLLSGRHAAVIVGTVGFCSSTGNLIYRNQKIDLGDLRYSVGVGIAWISPLGPLKLSYAYPINQKPEDRIQRFQFQIGTGF
jgi:outer membrane protein insertion porin family